MWTSNMDLPSRIREFLPLDAQTEYRNTYNAIRTQGGSKVDADKIAWESVKRSWEPGKSGKWVSKRKTLYVKRNLTNAKDLIDFVKKRGCKKTLQPDDMHVTVAYSKNAIEWPTPLGGPIVVNGGERAFESLGECSLVLRFECAELTNRWSHFRSAGASWDHEAYFPHVSISYEHGGHLVGAEAYDGVLEFGPEILEEINSDYTVSEKSFYANVLKVDSQIGVVFGWAIVSKIDNKPYYDLQGDYIPEETMLKSAYDFMNGPRVGGNMHRQQGGRPECVGKVVFALPLTSDIAKAMKIKCNKSGLIIGMKVNDPDVLDNFKNGTYTGFSIGGYRIKDDEVE